MKIPVWTVNHMSISSPIMIGLTVKLFADDVKMYVIINNVNDFVILQEGIDARTSCMVRPFATASFFTKMHFFTSW